MTRTPLQETRDKWVRTITMQQDAPGATTLLPEEAEAKAKAKGAEAQRARTGSKVIKKIKYVNKS